MVHVLGLNVGTANHIAELRRLAVMHMYLRILLTSRLSKSIDGMCCDLI